MSVEQKKQVNEKIIKALQENYIPWRCDVGFPRNILSQLRYDGVNPLLLNINCEQHKWATAYWGTYDQWASKGCVSKPIPPLVKIYDWWTEIVVYKPKNSGTIDQEICRWTVFNLDQIANGFDSLRMPPKPLDYSSVDKIIESTKADIRREPGLEAAYYYGEDYIIYPFKEQFVYGPGGLPAYYNSLFHELMHWTEPRLNWAESPEINELRAEIGADYLCTELGIPRLDISKRANHRKHINKWVEAMRQDADMIFRVTASASKGVDFILSHSKQVEPRHNPPA